MRERLIQLLSRYFDIGDSYTYNLTRVKTAFDVGTIGLDDFEEYTEDDVANLADFLIDNDVIAPPVKVGQTVWFIDGGYVKSGRKKTYEEYVNEGIVDNIVIGDKCTPQIEVCTALNEWITHDLEDDFNKYLFLTREAAEAALKARDNHAD